MRSSEGISESDVRLVLEHLAFVVHSEFPNGVVTKSDADRIILEALTDSDSTGLGFSPVEARRYGPAFIDIAEGSLGILVPQSLNQLSFFHRSIQEFLAASNLSRKDMAEQQAFIDVRGPDPRWRQVILGLFWNTRRREDVGRLLQRIDQKGDQAKNFELTEIRAEIAFGDFNCNPALIQSIAVETFEGIEQASWMPHRRRRLSIVLGGLRSLTIREMVQERLSLWIDARGIWRPSHYRGLRHWPATNETIAVLMTALNDEDAHVQLEVAHALPEVAGGQSVTGAMLAELATRSLNPRTRAAALCAFSQGWPSHPDLELAVEYGQRSRCPELRVAAIFARVESGVHDESDLEVLLGMIGRNSELSYGPWEQDISKALVKGWKGSDRLKNACLNGANRSFDPEAIDHSVAINVLLQAFPQDPGVSEYCVEQISTQEYLFLGGDHIDSWRWLSESFRDHPALIKVIDEWGPQKEHREPEVSFAALLGRTHLMKQTLINSLKNDNNSIRHWAASTLLEGWGMDDLEVADALTEVANGSNHNASQIAHLIPQIISDEDEAGTRLLELLTTPGNIRRDFVVSGFASIAPNDQNATVVEECLKLLPQGRRLNLFEDFRGQLIFSFPGHSDIRNLAIDDLLQADPNLGIVANAYSDDEEMRRRVSKHLTPLPTQLRGMIISAIGDANEDNDFSISILNQFEAESDADLKVLGSINYHRTLSRKPELPSDLIENLRQTLLAQGIHYQERRLAAFAGLLILGRLDVVSNTPRVSLELGYLPTRTCPSYV